MDIRLKQRLVGAVVLVALGVIFIPMVLQSPEQVQGPDTDIPTPPSEDFKDRLADAVPEPPPLPDQPPRQVLTPPETPPPDAAEPAATPATPPQATPIVTAELSNADDEAPIPDKTRAAPAGPGAWVPTALARAAPRPRSTYRR